jgi:anti-sigma B factor antagonist
MEITIKTIDQIKVAEISGDIDASSAPSVSEAILPLVEPETRIILDMTEVPYMSSAGLRTLLSTYRQVTAKNGKLILVGLSEEIQDTMTVTGFLNFFKTSETVEEAVKALQ